MGAGLVTNNSAPGILVQDDSSATVVAQSPISITQNPIGISVINASTVELAAAPSVTGNANGDLVCGAFSVAYGDASGVGRLNCSTFNPQNHGRPGQGHQGRPLP